MNFSKLRSCIYLSIRMYHPKKYLKNNKKKITVPNPGIQGKLSLLKDDMLLDNTDDFIEGEDYAEFEADYMKLGSSHKIHEKEVINAKDKLIKRIVKSKYIDEVEPSFLTFAEKIEIKALHAENPVLWTVEKLSESFPALPHIIKKILKTNWVPRSVNTVLRYDKNVCRNWENYLSGQIAVSPMLEKHLEKFKNRKIIVADKDYIEKHILIPEIKFPNPKSNIFSNIIKDYVNETKPKEMLDKKYLTSVTDDNDSMIKETSRQVVDSRTFMNMKSLNEKLVSQAAAKKKKEPQIFTEFLEDKITKAQHKTTPEAIVMRDVYKRHLEQNKKITDPDNFSVKTAKEDNAIEKLDKECAHIAVLKKEKFKATNLENVSDSKNISLETYIKEWIKKDEQEYDYPLCIKIPKNKYKEGMTYRVKDCYYDDDGVFLYRVPGLKI